MYYDTNCSKLFYVYFDKSDTKSVAADIDGVAYVCACVFVEKKVSSKRDILPD